MCDVNIATGEVTQFEYDILLPGPIPWTLARSYSSLDLRHGGLGTGWRLNLGTWLRDDGTNLELVVDGETMATLPSPSARDRGEGPPSEYQLDWRSGELIVKAPDATRYVFPHNGTRPPELQASAVRDFYGNALRYEYDRQGNLILLIDSMGRRIDFQYDLAGRILQILTPKTGLIGSSWQLVRYQYDANDDLVGVVDPLGHVTRYDYLDHLLTRVTDRNGRDLFYQYDSERRCIRTWFTGGVWDRRLNFDSRRHRTLVTDPIGYQTLYQNNEHGVTVSETDPLGRVREDILDGDGRILLRGRSTLAPPELIRYDKAARTVVLASNGRETIFVLDEQERPISMTDPSRGTSTFAYDEAGNDIRSQSPSGAVWEFTYNARGDLIKAVDPLGHERLRERTNGRLVMRDSFGIVEDARFDELGRNTAYTDAAGATVETLLDACGNPVVTKYPDGTRTEITFDKEGNPLRVADELGRIVSFEWSPDGTRLERTRPDFFKERFVFSLKEELVEITNGKNESAFLEYDEEGRCHRIRYFDERVEDFTFDDQDRPIALSDGRTGAPIASASYDEDGLTREVFPDGREVTVSHGSLGQIVTLANNDVSLRYTWDAEMRITQAQSDDLTIDYSYDLRGDCTSAVTNMNRRIDYQWDGRRRLTRILDSGRWTYELTYNVLDLVTELRMPNGVVVYFEYDVMHRMVLRRVVRTDGTEVCARRFSYDGAGRLHAYDDSLRGRRVFEYDPVDFLLAATDEGRAMERYEHDANGNLLITRDGRRMTYAVGDRLTRVGADELHYDDRGSLVLTRTAIGDARFTYSGEGWLSSASLPDGTVAAFRYDPLARRVSKVVNGRRTDYQWNGVHLLGETSDGDAVEYLFLPGSFFILGMTRGGRHFSFVWDQLGTPTEVLDDAGTIVWAGDYSPFGEITRLRADGVPQPFRFLGQYHDLELGWYYTRYRYYDPVTARFTCSDPLGVNAGLNLYAYAPNAVNWVDPFGLVALANVSTNGSSATCEVLSKCSWGPETMKEARKKVRTFNKAGCKVDKSTPCDEREGGYKEAYIKDKANGDDAKKASLQKKLSDKDNSCKSIQVDHIKDVQCGGQNDAKNLQELNQSVNASFGSQIKTCISRLPASFNGTIELKLVNRNTMTPAQQKNHKKKPCDNKKKKCP